MRTREQKSEYDVRFIRERCVKKTVLLNKEQDAEIIEHLKGVPNFNAYIKELIREDLEHRQAVERMNAKTDAVRKELAEITFPAVDNFRDEEAIKICMEEGHRIFVDIIQHWEVRVDVDTRKVLSVRDMNKLHID